MGSVRVRYLLLLLLWVADNAITTMVFVEEEEREGLSKRNEQKYKMWAFAHKGKEEKKMKRKVVVQGGAEQILVGLFLPIFFLMDCDPSVNALAGQKKKCARR
ncbi:hypothetical protein BKA57DRAFT_447633 [Linnemannia elongata]|nr:hypothetical protein BKA57DRAFT_447633 [Linnemannia elongata]